MRQVIQEKFMKIITTVEELHKTLHDKLNTAFVPTMGNLHEGHMSLMRIAKEYGAPVVASIFVNRLQFAPNEDFDQYPRTLEEDIAKLDNVGVDYLFAPSEKELYPEPQTFTIKTPDGLGNILEGQYRPGFFEGVATVVMKLFSCVQPSVAVFGKKDYQQLMIIRRLVQQFNLPIKIIGADLYRAENGLALSSRNRYLSESQSKDALLLYKTLTRIQHEILLGNRQLKELEFKALTHLATNSWEPDYVSVRLQKNLQEPTKEDLDNKAPLVVLAAAKIGTTRLIDNLDIFY